jgi:hypothetical protein
MSTKNNEPQFKTWDEYVDEAAHDPFLIPVSKTETITIPAPTGHQVTQFNRAARTGDPEAMLVTLCGDQWERVEKLLSTANHKVMENLMADMAIWFEVTEEITLVGPSFGDKPGAVVKSNDPRRIGKYLNEGYRPVGEAVSRT